MSEVSCESLLVSSILSLYTSLLPQSVRLFLLWLTVFWCSVPMLPFSFSSTITLGVVLLHFSSRTMFCTRRSPPGWTSTTWPVFWGREHRNYAHAIKVWWINIYIHTNMNRLHCSTISSLAPRRSAINNLLINLCFEDFILVYTSNVKCIQLF